MLIVLAAVLKDLAPTGKLRVAINYGNPVPAWRDPVSGAPSGITADLAFELGTRLGVPLEQVCYDAVGKVFAAIKDRAWDVAFLAIDPVRAEQILFTPPYVMIEGGYLVHENSPFRHIADRGTRTLRLACDSGTVYGHRAGHGYVSRA